ncbi:MAG: RNase H family protein [Myxococcota bacterium]
MAKWRKAGFKDQTVYARVNDDGSPLVEGGKVAIRYRKTPGARVYATRPERLSLQEGAAVESLDDGVSADAAPARKKTKGRGQGFGKAGTRSKQQAAAAREHAETLLASLESDTIVIFTDGACRGNPGPAGSGAFARWPDGSVVQASRSLGEATNNVAELTAVALALDILDAERVPPEATVALLSDSDYANGVLVRGWKAKANRTLITELRQRLADRSGLTLHWVAGHVGTEGNERADALANEGVAGMTEMRRIDR